jgi:hypothetical protein
LKTLFAWCVSEDILNVSPAATVRPPADDSELQAAWRASLTLGDYGEICWLLILTGARRSEVSQMCWSEIDVPAKTWTLPAMPLAHVRRRSCRVHGAESPHANTASSFAFDCEKPTGEKTGLHLGDAMESVPAYGSG